MGLVGIPQTYCAAYRLERMLGDSGYIQLDLCEILTNIRLEFACMCINREVGPIENVGELYVNIQYETSLPISFLQLLPNNTPPSILLLLRLSRDWSLLLSNPP